MAVASSSFNALGKPGPPLMLSILRMIVVLIPLAVVGSMLFGYVGIFAATGIANIVVGLIAWRWNNRTVASESAKIMADPVR
jgi:Na+-driven multidrug efflux pump